jgi:hypothetical protein
MWHLASAPTGPRPYGLKDAQVELLGWPKKGSLELEEQVRARGGNLKKGDHYLADPETLGKYACLDASSTAEVYAKLAPFFDTYDYWWMLEKMVEYSGLLQQCTDAGVRTDSAALEAEVEALTHTARPDMILLARLKKRKLILRDQITQLEDQVTPDIIA